MMPGVGNVSPDEGIGSGKLYRETGTRGRDVDRVHRQVDTSTRTRRRDAEEGKYSKNLDNLPLIRPYP